MDYIRIKFSEGNDVNKASVSKCFLLFATTGIFETKSLGVYQLFITTVLMCQCYVFDINNVAILNIIGIDYRSIIFEKMEP